MTDEPRDIDTKSGTDGASSSSETTQFIGSMAHDFNNLLALILGEIEFALMLNMNDAIREALATIRMAATQGATLTRQLLMYTRTDTKNLQDLDIAASIKSFARLILSAAGQSISVKFEFPPGNFRSRTDEGLLQHAIINLIANARDALPQGGAIRLRLSSHWMKSDTASADVPAHRRYVSLEVIDKGSGMDSETASLAFEPFFTTKEPGAGSGLGLASVARFVRQTGGTSEIISTPGVGTTVRLLLPAIRTEY